MGIVISNLPILVQELEKLRQQGKVIVSTNGVFDLLHVGHVRYLQTARQLGDVLVVGINSDTGTRQLKGSSRPITPQEERAEILAALTCVDYVTFFDEPTPEALLEQIRPHVHVKGGDYDPTKIPEAKVVEKYGGRVVVVPFVQGHSTTKMLQRIRDAYANP